MNRKRFVVLVGGLVLFFFLMIIRHFWRGPQTLRENFLSADAVELFESPPCPADRTVRVQYQTGDGETLGVASAEVLVQSHACEPPKLEDIYLAKSVDPFPRWKRVRLLAQPGEILESLRVKNGQLFLSVSGQNVAPFDDEAWAFSKQLSLFLASADVRNRILPADTYLMAEEETDSQSPSIRNTQDVMFSSTGPEANLKFRLLSFVKKSEILGKILDP